MNAVGSQNLQVKFQMMPYLLCGAFQERPDRFQIRRTGDRHVPCLVRFSAKETPSRLSMRGFRPVVSVSKHQESYFSSSAAMAERASGVSAIIYSCLKSSTVSNGVPQINPFVPNRSAVLPTQGRRVSPTKAVPFGGGSKQIIRREGAFLDSGAFSRTAWPAWTGIPTPGEGPAVLPGWVLF